jgi:hypothetical protein
MASAGSLRPRLGLYQLHGRRRRSADRGGLRGELRAPGGLESHVRSDQSLPSQPEYSTCTLIRGLINFPAPGSTADKQRFTAVEVIQGFVADVGAALQTFGVTGAAVALVQDERVVLARGFGVGDVQRRLPVTERTRFRIASNTKSMTAFLVATFVDEGVMSWDDRVVDVWPEFRAPTPELTAALRVRDLLGMGSGIAESPTIEFFMIGGGESALDVLRLDHDIRSTPLLALPGGGYVVTSGPGMILARKVNFAGDAATQLTMTIEGFDSVRWLTAG